MIPNPVPEEPMPDQAQRQTLPVIDIAGLNEGAKLVEIAAEIRAACTRPGFFYIRNHGVPDAAIAARRQSRTPKDSYQRAGSRCRRVYTPRRWRSLVEDKSAF